MRRLKPALVLGAVDQGALSLGSLLVIVAAAQGLSPAQLGSFSFGIATAALAQSITRALAGETVIARSAEAGEHEQTAMVGFVVAIAAGCAVILGALAWARIGADVAWLGLAVAVPGVLTQDAARYLLIARQRAVPLASTDIVIVAAQLAGVCFFAWRDQSVEQCLIAWGLPPLLGAAVILARLRVPVSPRAGFRWCRQVWRQSSAYATEAIVGALSGYATLATIALVVSPAAVAAFRTTISVFGVLSVVVNFLRSSYMRDLADRSVFSRASVTRIYVSLGVGVFGVTSAMAIVLWVLPPSIGIQLFGQTWTAVHALILFGAIDRLLAGLSVIPTIVLRLQGVTWVATRIRIAIALAALVVGPLGAALAGPAGALIAESVTYLAVFALLSRLVWMRLRTA